MAKEIRVLFIADIVGQPGLSLLETLLPGLIRKHEADFVVANAENSHEGRGVNEEIVKTLYSLGVHVITGGNHSFDKWMIFPYMKEDPHLLRPYNYPKGNPGFGYCIREVPGIGVPFAVINLQGRTYLPPIDDPFTAAERLVEKIRQQTPLILVDFHAEATAEKMALAWTLDSRVSLFIGTHTHVPTNDARILPGGTGFITDAGMTGSFDSVIGMDKKTAILRFTRATPQRHKTADGDNRICGVAATIDAEKGRCLRIEPVIYPSFKTTRE